VLAIKVALHVNRFADSDKPKVLAIEVDNLGGLEQIQGDGKAPDLAGKRVVACYWI
jgi:hypothetical protein